MEEGSEENCSVCTLQEGDSTSECSKEETGLKICEVVGF